VKGVDNRFPFFTGIIEPFQISRGIDFLRRAGGVNQPSAFVGSERLVN
jgi:hypothetical protein